MASVQLSESRVQDFHAITVSNDLISFTILPELGGKITSIYDLRACREWLWTNPRLPYRKLEYGTSYVAAADTGGWDECFPTIAPCSYPLKPWQGLRLPDHGELWSKAWYVNIEERSDSVTYSTEVNGTALPYVFHRSVSLAPHSDTLRLYYAVRNLGESEMSFIWSAHPMFTAEPGMRVLLPENTRMHTYASIPPELSPKDSEYEWPVHISAGDKELSFPLMPDATTGVAIKFWSRPLAEGWTALLVQDGAFRFEFDPELVPRVGLWLNAGGWSGIPGDPYYNLGLEPCIGAQDSLQEAVEHYGQYECLQAGSIREWWLDVTLVEQRG